MKIRKLLFPRRDALPEVWFEESFWLGTGAGVAMGALAFLAVPDLGIAQTVLTLMMAVVAVRITMWGAWTDE